MNARWPGPGFTRSEIFFSLKSFLAAMLAMGIASSAGLPRPFWAMLTSYVVAAPLAGNVRSKGLFRFLGTLVGCTATIFLVPALSSAPELLVLALALWVGGCLYVSLLDRTARAYAFMLAGYTAALIGFPSVETPLALFDNAVARVEEIGLGILCATAVHSLVFPVGLAPTLLAVLDRSLGDARTWFADLLRAPPPHPDTGATPDALSADRQRLAGDITQLRLLSTHVPFDTSHLRWTAGAIGAMQDRLAALTPALSAVEDRLQALAQAEGDLAPDIVSVLARVAAWLQAGAADVSAHDRRPESRDLATDGLRASLRSLGVNDAHADLEDDISPAGPTASAGADRAAWRRALRIGLAVRLDELVLGWRACENLRQAIDAGLTGAAPPGRRVAALSNRVLHRDRGLAILSSLAAIVAICLCCAFWIATAWPSGSAAALMAAVFCCFFATMDNPVPAISSFLKYTAWSAPISAVYVLVLLPLVHDFGMLVLVCAPVFLVLGAYAGRASTQLMGMAMLFGVAGTLSIHDTTTVDLPGFLNSQLAQLLGIFTAALVTRLMRTVGSDWSARRIRRATWRELGDMAAARRGEPIDEAFGVRLLDRIALLAPRVAQAAVDVRSETTEGALRDLRTGVDIAALQRSRPALPDGMVGASLAGLAALFRALGHGRGADPAPRLLGEIDRALRVALDAPARVADSEPGRVAVTALVGLRRNLFPQAPATLGPSAAGGIA